MSTAAVSESSAAAHAVSSSSSVAHPSGQSAADSSSEFEGLFRTDPAEFTAQLKELLVRAGYKRADLESEPPFDDEELAMMSACTSDSDLDRQAAWMSPRDSC